jgi:hypothetical protein
MGYKILLLQNLVRFRLLSLLGLKRLIEASMAIFDHSEHSQARLGPTTGEQRLPLGQSIAVIAGLSVASWAVLIFLVVAIRAVL